MTVSLNSGAFASFHALYKAASDSATKYALFPVLSQDRTTSLRWRRELLKLKCIKEIVVDKNRYYAPIIEPSNVKENKSKIKPKLTAATETPPDTLQTSFIPPPTQTAPALQEKTSEHLISLTPGAYESFIVLHKNIKKTKAKMLSFPRLTNNRNSVIRWREELLEKHCIKSVEVTSDRRQYLPLLEPYQVTTTGDNRGARHNERPEAPLEALPEASVIERRHEHPISRGRHVPNGHTLIEFVNAVQREFHVLKTDRMKKIGEEIANVKIELTNTEDVSYEDLYLKELKRLVESRSQINDQALIDAIKYIEAKKEFSDYQWSNELVSIRPEDYMKRTID